MVPVAIRVIHKIMFELYHIRVKFCLEIFAKLILPTL